MTGLDERHPSELTLADLVGDEPPLVGAALYPDLDPDLITQIEVIVAGYSANRWLARKVIETDIAAGRTLADSRAFLDRAPILRAHRAVPPPVPGEPQPTITSITAPLTPRRPNRVGGRNRRTTR